MERIQSVARLPLHDFTGQSPTSPPLPLSIPVFSQHRCAGSGPTQAPAYFGKPSSAEQLKGSFEWGNEQPVGLGGEIKASDPQGPRGQGLCIW